MSELRRRSWDGRRRKRGKVHLARRFQRRSALTPVLSQGERENGPGDADTSLGLIFLLGDDGRRCAGGGGRRGTRSRRGRRRGGDGGEDLVEGGDAGVH